MELSSSISAVLSYLERIIGLILSTIRDKDVKTVESLQCWALGLLGLHEAVSSILIQIYRTVFKRVWLEFSLIKSIFSFEITLILIQTQDKSLRNNSMTFVS